MPKVVVTGSPPALLLHVLNHKDLSLQFHTHPLSAKLCCVLGFLGPLHRFPHLQNPRNPKNRDYIEWQKPRKTQKHVYREREGSDYGLSALVGWNWLKRTSVARKEFETEEVDKEEEENYDGEFGEDKDEDEDDEVVEEDG